MAPVFLLCALLGGIVLFFQLAVTLTGIGDSGGLDVGGDVPDSLDVDLAADGADGAIGDPHGSSSLFQVLSFRTVVAATTFFGLSGMAARSAGFSLPFQLGIAIACGLAAMYGVYWLMRSVYGLSQSGTLNITNAIGRTGTVYVTIPRSKSAAGKVHLRIQERLEEFPAVTTAEENLPTGAKVVVVGVVSGNTLEVKPASAG